MTDPLPRRGLLGLTFDPERPFTVARVLDQGPAHRAALCPGDTLTRLGDTPLDSLDARHRALQSLSPGAPLAVAFLRDGSPHQRTLTPIERPREAHTRYHHTAGPYGRLRVLATGPEAPARAVMLYLQGVGTHSVESRPESPLGALLSALGEAGVTVLRVERTGIGDSEGPRPQTLGFFDALADCQRLVDWAAAHPVYGARPLTLFGHSLGGLWASLVAAHPAVRSQLLYGVGSTPWPEYLARHARTMLDLAPHPEGEAWREARALRDHWLLDKRRSFDELGAICPDFAANPSRYGVAPDGTFDGHGLRFWQELSAIDPVGPLCEAAKPSTVAWGDCDFQSYRDEHEALARALAAAHPGAARYETWPDTDHGFVHRRSMAESHHRWGQGPLSGVVLGRVMGHLDWAETAHASRASLIESR
ncbi:MAG: alpha/beta fold hydrolase [Myxococcales bacterium]|nr:alpha/beta fold hydrolase [Myxococcales bacterium]